MQTLVSCHPFATKKKIFALCACNTLRRWKPGCFSLYWRCLGRYHSYRSSWSSGTVENTTCQSRSGMTKFPNPLSHRSQPSHDPKPWQCITYRPLSMKRDALEQSLGPNNSFSGSSVACLQNGFGLNVPWVPRTTTVRCCVSSIWQHLCAIPQPRIS